MAMPQIGTPQKELSTTPMCHAKNYLFTNGKVSQYINVPI